MISAQAMVAVLLIYGFMRGIESINSMFTGVIHDIVQANSLLGGSKKQIPSVPYFREPPYGIELDIRKTIAVQYSLPKTTQA
jgi:hypothetical protein